MENNLNLMVGDWVQDEIDGIKLKVEIVGHHGNPSFVFASNDKGAMTQNGVQPIPLSPDLMERVEGMKKGYSYNVGIAKECYMYFSIGFMIRHNSYYVDFIGGNLEVKYLHQLQQLIRLFTNKEIEVKW